MSSTSTVERHPLLAHHPIGPSTGYMTTLRGDWQRLVSQAANFSLFAVELSALSEPELAGLKGYLAATPRLPFRYLSVHGPSKDRALSEPDLVNELLALVDRTDAIVMHPDTMSDPAPYRRLGRTLVLENMDADKSDGCTVAQLEPWFAELPEAGFCFDVAHAWSLDPTMTLAHDLLDAFGSRAREVHVSSLDRDLHHVPMCEDDEALFMPVLERCVDLPWIFEAPPRGS